MNESADSLFSRGQRAYDTEDLCEATRLLKLAITRGLTGNDLSHAYRLLHFAYNKLQDQRQFHKYAILHMDCIPNKRNHSVLYVDCDVRIDEDDASVGSVTEERSKRTYFEIRSDGDPELSGDWSNRPDYAILVQSGRVTLTFFRYGYGSEEREVLIQPGEVRRVSFKVVMRPSTVPLSYSAVSGRAVDARTGAGIPKVRLAFFLDPVGETVVCTSNLEGDFSVEIERGLHVVRIECAGYVESMLTLVAESARHSLGQVVLYRSKKVSLLFESVGIDERFGRNESTFRHQIDIPPDKFSPQARHGVNFATGLRASASPHGRQSTLPIANVVFFHHLDSHVWMYVQNTQFAHLPQATWDSVRDTRDYVLTNPPARIQLASEQVYVFASWEGAARLPTRQTKMLVESIEELVDP